MYLFTLAARVWDVSCPTGTREDGQSFQIFSGSLLRTVSSVEDGIYALGKAHMRSTRSLGSFPNVAFETVAMFVWLTMAPSLVLSRKICLALPLSTPLSSRSSKVWCPWPICLHAGRCLQLYLPLDLALTQQGCGSPAVPAAGLSGSRHRCDRRNRKLLRAVTEYKIENYLNICFTCFCF